MDTCLCLLAMLIQTHKTMAQKSAVQAKPHMQQWANNGNGCCARLATLRQIVSLLKLATLLASVENISPRAIAAESLLWRTLDLISQDLVPDASGQLLEEPELEQATSVLLVEMVVPLVRQEVNMDFTKALRNNSEAPVMKLLHHLLKPYSLVSAVPHAVGAAMVKQGRALSTGLHIAAGALHGDTCMVCLSMLCSTVQ